MNMDYSDLSGSDGNSQSPNRRGKNLQIEFIEDGKVTNRSVTFSSEWNSRSNSVEMGRIVNLVCLKLLRGDTNYCGLLEWLLNSAIHILESEIGVVCAVEGGPDGSLTDVRDLTCIALGEKQAGLITRGDIVHNNRKSTDQKSMNGIFGYCLTTNQIIISNNVPSDPRIKLQMPINHPSIHNILIIPLIYQSHNIGTMAIANSKFGYTPESVNFILPLIEIVSKVLVKTLDSKETLLSQIQKSRNAQDIKERFLSTMSHELRTPLNGIMGMVTLLPDAGPLNEKQREYIRNLTECSVELSGLLNNILDFSKMASNHLVLRKNSIVIQDVINDSIRIVEGNIVSKGIELKTEIQDNIPVLIGDRQRLVQILSNLLTNAGKFTEKGSICICVQSSPVSCGTRESCGLVKRWKISFQVKDTGIGVPLEEQDKIFEVFHQGSTLSTYLAKSGTGLGLSIARELTRLMGGKISVESSGVPGEGSVFSFYIILDEEIDVTLLNKQHIKLLSGAKVLVVDDRPEIRLHLSDMLFKWKCLPQAVSSAEEALQYLSYSSDFRVALVDINMPNMSGVELAQEIRCKYPKLPLIGISSVELAAGEEYFDFYMYKPIEQNVLFPALLKCLSHPRKRTSRHKKSKRRLNILVAEDDRHNTYTMKEMLVNLGYREKNITFVSDGESCVRTVSSCPGKYDVVLMDIIMPRVDGIEAAKIIKRNPRHPMIIAVSAAVHSTDKARCQIAGFDGYLPKPIIRDRLEAALHPLIKTRRSSKKTKGKDVIA